MKKTKMIKVLIVDDSKVVQEFMKYILSLDPDIQIVGIASSGHEAIELAREMRPDVISMDFHMPDMNGCEAACAIMKTTPTPIVIVTASMSTEEVIKNFSPFENGALEVVLRPPGMQHPDFVTTCNMLIQTLKRMSEIKVISLFPPGIKEQIETLRLLQTFENNLMRIQVIAIGASTGGLNALQKILSGLPEDLPVPVLIVQHISEGFVKEFVEWLSLTSGIKLKIAEDGEPISAGIGYIAPDNFHMGVSQGSKINLCNCPSENGFKPSVNYLFRSVAQTFGSNALGVLLTGIGKDGVDELKVMKDKGALTLVQDEESSDVFGMSAEAIKTGASDHILSIEKINDFFKDAVKVIDYN
jgi:two-component system chemotaxis response regulator CheB